MRHMLMSAVVCRNNLERDFVKFEIDEQYLRSVVVIVNLNPYKDHTELTPEELVNAMSVDWSKQSYSTSMVDHPVFEELREKLSAEGYIKIQRGWSNGDTVLKPFELNGYRLKKNETFPCAPALGGSIKLAKKLGRKTLV